jgi:hypothetical protein
MVACLQILSCFNKEHPLLKDRPLLKDFHNSLLNPLTPTRRWTDAHFRRFLTVLEYSPIGEKFSPTIAPRTLYTVKEKNWEIFKTFLFIEVLRYLRNFDVKIRFLI